jgi:hypothetical protein
MLQLRGSVPSPAETAAASPAAHDASHRRHARVEDSSPLESPWLWIGIAGIVVSGVVLALVLSSSHDDASIPKGTLTPSVSVLTRAP